MKFTLIRHPAAMLLSACAAVSVAHAADSQNHIRDVVDEVIAPLMQRHGVPGMAVGIITPDEHQVFDYGVASKSTRKPVTKDTLFEIGSISKTFTATLASYAQVKGDLSLTDSASRFLPALKGTSLEKVSLLNLGTHTPGGMPLQFPDGVTNTEQMMAYFKAWTPAYAPGSYRTYANPSIGMLGVITAKAMEEDFITLMQGTLYPALGLTSTYLEVPPIESGNYAQGYTKKDEPIRMTPGILDAQAYGVRTTASDIVRFIEANMGRIDLDDDVQKAVTETHTGYYRVGAMTQDLIWEQYAYPVDLDDLLTGNSDEVSYKPNAVTEIAPPLSPRKDVWINKTGSTNGFGAYVAFVPAKGLGIVLLANKNYPMDARVTAAHQILTKLDSDAQPRN
jgi:beta-lactamase class C